MIFGAAAAALALAPSARADTWDGSASALWSGTANWADNTEPTATDPVIFPTPIPATGGSISLSATEQAASLTFNDNYSLGANFLQLNAAGGPITVASGKTATISSNLTGTVGITKNGSGTLNLLATLNGFTGTTTIAGGTLSFNTNNDFGQAANTISLNSGTLKNNLSVTTSRTIDIGIFSPTISQTGQWTQNGAFGASANPINITGTGILALNAASTRSGSTTIQNGTVRLTNGAALGTGGTHVSSNGILELGAGATASTFTVLQNTATLRTSGAGAVDPSVSADPSASVTLNAGDLSTHTLTISSYAGGSGSTTHVTGSGEVILSGSNTYTGGWAADSGTLRLTHADAITASASPIVINSGGTVSAEVASNYAGAWSIGGLLRVLHGQGTGTAAAILNVNNGGALQVEGVDFTRNVALNGGGTLRGTGAATASGTITAANAVPQVTLASGASATDTLTVSNYTGGSGSTTFVTGTGTVFLPAASTYAGGWQLNAGTLRMGNSSALGVGTSAVGISNAATLQVDSGVGLARDVTMNTGSTLKAGAGGFNAFISSTVSVTSGADVNLASATNGSLTVAQGLIGGGSGSSITVAGGSRVNRFLSGASSYVGDWIVTGTGSSLSIYDDNQLGDAANPVTLDNAGQLVIDESTTSARVITIGNGGGEILSFGTLTLNSGLAGGSGSLFIGGSGGGVVLNAASSWTGPTIIDRTDSSSPGPVVRVNNNTALGTGTVQVGEVSGISTAELQLGDGVVMNQPATLVIGTIRGNGNCTYAGTITVPVTVFTDVFLATGAEVSHTLTVASYAGGSLADTHITGSGKVIFSGANTYNGAYIVDSGTLRLTHANAISSAVSPIAINAGGTVEAAAASTYAGNWQLNGGTLRVQNATGTGTGTARIVVGASSTLQIDNVSFGRALTLSDGGTLAGTGSASYSNSGEPKITNALANVFLKAPGAGDRLTINSAIRSETAAASLATIHVNGAGRVVLNSGGTSATDVFGGSWEQSGGVLQIANSGGIAINGLGFKNGDAKQANTVTVNGGTLAVGGLGSGTGTPQFLRANVVVAGGNIASTNGVDAQYGGDFTTAAATSSKVLLFDPVTPAVARSVTLTAGAAGADNLAATTHWAGTLVVDPGTASGGAFNLSRTGGTIVVDPGALLQVSAGATVNVGGTADALSDGTHHLDVLNDGTMRVLGGSKNVGGVSGAGDTNVQLGFTLSANHLRQNALSVADGARVNIRANGGDAGASRLATLTLTGSAELDLEDNKLIVATAGQTGVWNGSAYDGITGQVASGRNGGDWAGSGIVTSLAANNADYTSLGVASGADVRGLSGSATDTFAGQTVHAADTLVMFTYGGDANLDGLINIDDYTQIDSSASIGGALKGWFNGDFNYDGNVDIDDYTIIDSNIGIQSTPFSTAGGGSVAGATAVPEPAGVAVAGLCGVLALRRRGRARR